MNCKNPNCELAQRNRAFVYILPDPAAQRKTCKCCGWKFQIQQWLNQAPETQTAAQDHNAAKPRSRQTSRDSAHSHAQSRNAQARASKGGRRKRVRESVPHGSPDGANVAVNFNRIVENEMPGAPPEVKTALIATFEEQRDKYKPKKLPPKISLTHAQSHKEAASAQTALKAAKSRLAQVDGEVSRLSTKLTTALASYEKQVTEVQTCESAYQKALDNCEKASTIEKRILRSNRVPTKCHKDLNLMNLDQLQKHVEKMRAEAAGAPAPMHVDEAATPGRSRSADGSFAAAEEQNESEIQTNPDLEEDASEDGADGEIAIASLTQPFQSTGLSAVGHADTTRADVSVFPPVPPAALQACSPVALVGLPGAVAESRNEDADRSSVTARDNSRSPRRDPRSAAAALLQAVASMPHAEATAPRLGTDPSLG